MRVSLRTQLTLLVAFSALLSFVGNFAITLDNTRQYLAAQLDTHAQDTATSLGFRSAPGMPLKTRC